jgi:tRNA dimethylallyltransferase
VQVYRGLDIGSGKPSANERAEVPHALLDLVHPDQHFHAAAWAAAAREAIAAALERRRLPIIVGGTGLYFRALTRGLFEAPAPDPVIRARHAQLAEAEGVPRLWGRLSAVDPEAAASLHRTDLVRISRALEVFEQTGEAISLLRRRARPAEQIDLYVIVLEPSLTELRPRIDHRVDDMMAQGFLGEVEALRAAGFAAARALRSLGYLQLSGVLAGERDLASAVAEIKRATAQYARRQRTWFRGEAAARRLAAPPDGAAKDVLVTEVRAWLRQRPGWRTFSDLA